MAPKVNEVSVAQFAEIWGKTSQRVYQMIQKGMPHRRIKGVTMIVPREAIAWLIEWETWELQESRRKASGTDIPDEEEERALKMKAERQLKELELMERAKELVPAADLNEFIERVFGGFAAVVMGRIQRFEREIVRANTPPDARKLVEKIKTALMNGARSYADQLDDEAAELSRDAERAKPKAKPTDEGEKSGE